MKRALIIVGVVVLVLVGIPVGVMITAFGGMSPISEGKELPGGVRIIKDGFTSAALIPFNEKEVALVDAGSDKKGTAILAELSRRGLTSESVKAILLTHGHADHLGAIPLFPNAQVMALEPEVMLAEGRVAARGPLPRFFGAHLTGVRVARALRDGEVFRLGNIPVQVFAVPGHTQGSAAYLIEGALYLGDSAGATKDGRLAPAVWAFSDDAAQNHASLKTLADRLGPQRDQVRFLVPAHSGVLDGFGPLQALASSL